MMTTTPISRRTLLTLLAGVGVASITGCAAVRRSAADRTAAVPDVVLVEVGDGLGILRGTDRHTIPQAIASADGLAMYTTAAEGADTAFWRIAIPTGQTSARVRLPGRWVPQTVSANGMRVALTAQEVTATTGRPDGRTATPVLIADVSGIQHRFELPGNFVPEAFTADHTGLFVLEWLPAYAPDRYRVRVVDLATKAPGPLFTRDKAAIPPGAEEEMRGEGRQAVLAPNGTTLYTLYTHQPDHQHTRDLVSGRPSGVHAFVHTLDLVGRWAYCIDLPHPFGDGPASGHAMAISPDGGRLFVADTSSGTVAEISTEALAVRRTARLAPQAGTTYAVAGSQRLYVGAGTTVRTVDPARLGVSAEWAVRESVAGLVLSRGGERLYVGQSDAVAWHDTATGDELGRASVPGLVGVSGLAGRV